MHRNRLALGFISIFPLLFASDSLAWTNYSIQFRDVWICAVQVGGGCAPGSNAADTTGLGPFHEDISFLLNFNDLTTQARSEIDSDPITSNRIAMAGNVFAGWSGDGSGSGINSISSSTNIFRFTFSIDVPTDVRMLAQVYPGAPIPL